jgi:hypothetical protein
MLGSAVALKYPHPSYTPPGWSTQSATGTAVLAQNVNVSTAIRLPQFAQLFTILLTISAGGIAMFSVAKTMMGEVFMRSLPSIVDPVFCSNYVLMLSLGNLLGKKELDKFLSF